MINMANYEIAVQLMGLSMCLFMALFFFMDSLDKQNPTKSPRRFLAGFMFIYGFTFLDGFLIAIEYNSSQPNMHALLIPAYFLLGPFLYFYVRDTCSVHSYLLIRPRLKHFTGFAMSLILLVPFFLLPETEKELIFSKNVISSSEAMLPWVAIFGILAVHILLVSQILFYLVQSFRVLIRNFDNLKQFFSNVEDNRLNWIRNLIIILSLSWAVYTYEAAMAWPEVIDHTKRIIISAINVGIIYFISFRGLRQIAIFRDQFSAGTEELPKVIQGQNDDKQKYAKSSLSKEDAERILSKLNRALFEEELYADSMLSLRGLSDHTKISPNYISQVINQNTDSHFFDFINNYRIEAAMKKLRDLSEKKSILDIAYEVGFNSKSTFNAAFKRIAGLTPSEYRKNQIEVLTA